ncbi:RDD family protein [Brevibacterium sp.]|uniref:RDD family protein n=1 Tax=Brevibacterium sp. TaxID=1701 RepID=UPI0028118F18|nr:RDD family protein [Brevibacterium sp.]
MTVTTSHHGHGTWRRGQLLRPASATRRWWARIIDALLILVLTSVTAVTAMSLYGATVLSLDAATAAALLSYPAVLLLFGALYGCTLSPGQAMMGVVSLRTHDGRRVGFWRGMGRYLGVGLFPIALVVLIWTLFEATSFGSAPIRVCQRVR